MVVTVEEIKSLNSIITRLGNPTKDNKREYINNFKNELFDLMRGDNSEDHIHRLNVMYEHAAEEIFKDCGVDIRYFEK